MKKHFTVLALLALFAACKKDTAPQNSNADSIPKQEAPDTPVAKLAGQLGGLWIKDSYMANIEKSKSIYASRDNNLLGFDLITDSLAKGLGNVRGFGEHEGGYEWAIKYNAAANRFDLDPNRTEAYQKAPEFYIVSAEKDRLEIVYTNPPRKECYRRVGNDKATLKALNHELNRILFEGSYTDSLHGSKITFTRQGQVTGMGSSTAYELVFDFVGPEESFDIVRFTGNLKEIDNFHFKIKGNTLYLYPVKDHGLSYDPKPVYVLKKN